MGVIGENETYGGGLDLSSLGFISSFNGIFSDALFLQLEDLFSS